MVIRKTVTSAALFLVSISVLWTCSSGDGTEPVPAGPPASVELAFDVDTLTWLGQAETARVRVLDAGGNPRSGDVVTWSSTDVTTITVSSAGVVTAIANGDAHVVVSLDALADSVLVSVDQRAAAVTIDVPQARFEAVGEQVQLTAAVVDQGGTPLPDPGQVLWASTNTLVAMVGTSGLVTTTGNGTADITATADSADGGATISVAAPLAFINANLVPMSADVVIPNQTVLVAGDRIEDVGATGALAVPAGYHVIDAAGQFLMPGLTDMHVHMTCETGTECLGDTFLYLANGITTLRYMWGSPFQLRLRDLIAEGQVLGPTMFVASPGIDGPNGSFDGATATVAEARAKANAAVDAGYDYLKVYNALTPDMYAAIMDVSLTRGVRVIGHKPFALRFGDLLTGNHLTFEHLLGYEQEAAPTGSIWNSDFDANTVRALAAQAATVGAAETPTYAPFAKIIGEVNLYQNDPNARFVSPGVANFSTTQLPPWQTSASNRDTRLRRQHDMLQILREEGVTILLGTDAGVRWVLPGFSIHEELGFLVAAGMTPFEALQSGTVFAAEFLDSADEFGTIEIGKRADMILLEANPLDAVTNVDRRIGVLARGVWLPESVIDATLEDIAGFYGR